jgi:hypothetical protein
MYEKSDPGENSRFPAATFSAEFAAEKMLRKIDPRSEIFVAGEIRAPSGCRTTDRNCRPLASLSWTSSADNRNAKVEQKSSQVKTRVARSFLVQDTNTGKKYTK